MATPPIPARSTEKHEIEDRTGISNRESAPYARGQQPRRVFECESTFPPGLTAAMLETTFGAQRLGTGQIHTGD